MSVDQCGGPSHLQRGSKDQPLVSQLKAELETVRQKFYNYQMRKDQEVKEVKAEREHTVHRLEFQLRKTAQELKRVSEHSTNQSKKIQDLQSSSQVAVEGECLHVQKVVEQQQNKISDLEREKKELANDVAAARTTANMYMEDFEKERRDRARAAGKIDSLERDAADRTHDLAARFQIEMSQVESERRQLQEDLAKALQDVQQKAAQVKQYKKQVEGLQRDVQQAKYMTTAETEDMVFVQMPEHRAVQRDGASGSQRGLKLQLPWKSKSRDDVLKAQDKATMKAAKRQRQQSVEEGKELRKLKMDSMDDNRLKVFLGEEINRLENENLVLRNTLEHSEETVKYLVEKLTQTEAQVMQEAKSPIAAVQHHSHGREIKKQIHQQNGQGRYVSMQQLRSDHRALKQVSGPKHKDAAAAIASGDTSHHHPVTDHHTAHGDHHKHTAHGDHHRHVAHHDPHKHMHRQHSFSDLDTERETQHLDTSDPRLKSKDADYVNSDMIQPPPRPQVALQSNMDQKHHLKPPKASPRAASLDAGRGGPLINIPESHQPTSMPATVNTERGNDISERLEDDIHNEAAEVAEWGRDERTLTLTSIPFDPFLECLYCNQWFRYGEIQKYRKHVNGCSGGSGV